MVAVHEGQCGLCAHFGEQAPVPGQVIEIRRQHEAPEGLIEECGHPKLAPLHLKVTPMSGCSGFQSASSSARA